MKENKVTPALLAELETILGKERCLTAPEDRTAYSYDMFARGLPDLVVLPENTREVSAVLSLAAQNRIPVTPRGAGTSLTGGPVPVNGGMVMAMTRMNRILEISVTDRLVRTQPGVVTADLQSRVGARGLCYPPNPTSADYCTIGGNIATNAGGASGVKYGVTADYILGLTMVLADGRILNTGGPCIKSVSGFDFKRAFCGSEGLLGVITEACLRLIPAPADPRTSLIYFSTMETAADAVAAIIENSLTPSTMELMDDRFLAAVSRVYGLTFPEDAGAALLVEFDDGPDRWPDQENRLKSACKKAIRIETARTDQERSQLWQARKGGTAALVRHAGFLQTLDFAVPVSRIARGIRGVQEIASNHGLDMVLIAHAGDGNLHPMFIYDPDDPLQKQAFETAEKQMCRFILSISGTLSGEHGIGIEKAAYLGDELSPVEISLGKALKQLLDPAGILNPGKCGC
jgi:glycolate oxidase